MPGFTVTRGLGGSVSSLISLGFFEFVRQIKRGGTRFVKKAAKELQENIKISVMLLSVNGKELSKPIISNISKLFGNEADYTLDVIPKKLIARKSEDISVKAELSYGEKNESN